NHSCDSHESCSLCSIASKLATHLDHGDYYGHRSISSLFAAGRSFGVCAPAASLLAAVAAHAGTLCGADPSGEDMVAEEVVNLRTAKPAMSRFLRFYVYSLKSPVIAASQAMASDFFRGGIRFGSFPSRSRNQSGGLA